MRRILSNPAALAALVAASAVGAAPEIMPSAQAAPVYDKRIGPRRSRAHESRRYVPKAPTTAADHARIARAEAKRQRRAARGGVR